MAAAWSLIGARSVRSTQALTEAAPTQPNEGILLDGVGALVPVLRAPNGQTFVSGLVRGWMFVDALGHWVRAPRADDDLADFAGLNEAALPALPVNAPNGRFALICDGVVLSGGSQVTVDLYASGRTSKGEAL